tara:strand:+ start:803 stop:4225 length:3423 start_codon:yes stop_codon:yes gene_type:complete
MTSPIINNESINPGAHPAYIKDITLFNRGDTLVVETSYLLKQVLGANGSVQSAADMRDRLLGKLGVLLVATTDLTIARSIFQDRNSLKNFLPVSNESSTKTIIMGIPTAGEKTDLQLAQMGALNSVDLPYRRGLSFTQKNPNYLAVFVAPISKPSVSDLWEPSTTTIGLLASELVIKNGILNTDSVLFFLPGPNGKTSYEHNHRHNYVGAPDGHAEEVCMAGNILLEGAAAEAQLAAPVTSGPGPEIPPGTPVVCHSHAIINGVVQPAGAGPHTHNLVASPSDGVLWIGDTHKDSNGQWRTGPLAAPTGSLFLGKLLTPKTIQSSKIFDQRNLDRIERLQVEFGSATSLVGVNVKGALRKKIEVREHFKNKAPAFISDVHYSKGGANNLRLTFAFNYLEAIKKNGIYAPLYDQNNDLLQTCTVKSFRVVRRRVKAPNIYNKLTGGDTPQRIYNEEPLEIIGAPVRIGTLGVNSGVYQYMITDQTMDNITVGLYEYGIEVSIIDNTKSKLMNILRGEDGLDVLIPGIENFLTESLLKNNYDIITNRYTKEFLSRLKATYGTTLAPGTPWVRAAMKYIGALQLLFGTKFGSAATLRTTLLSAIDPAASGPAGMQFLLKILQNFASSLRTAIGEDHPRAPGAAQVAATSTQGASSRLKVFKIHQFFLNPFNADELLDYGFDYLSVAPQPAGAGIPASLRRLTLSQFNNLTQLQLTKLSGPGEGGIVENPNVKFLTPNFLKMPDGSVSNVHMVDADGNLQDEAAVNKIYQLLLMNMKRNSPPVLGNDGPAPNNDSSQVPMAQSTRYLVQNQIMQQNSCNVSVFQQSNENPIANIFSISEATTVTADDYKHLIDTNEYFSSTSKFANPIPSIVLNFSLSGSTNDSLMLPGVSADGANIVEAQEANSSLISEYLLQADFFTHPGPSSPLPSLPKSGQSIYNNDTTLQTIKIQQQSVVSYMNSPQFSQANAGGGPTLLLRSQPQPMVVSEVDVAYVNSAIAGNIKPENIALDAVKYGFVHVVEYMVGYKVADGKSLLSEAIWAYLNDSILGLVGQGKSFLCRLRKNPGPMGDIQGLEVPTYDKYFILGNGSISPTVAPGTNPIVPPYPVPLEALQELEQFAESLEFASSYDSEVDYGGTVSPLFGLL